MLRIISNKNEIQYISVSENPFILLQKISNNLRLRTLYTVNVQAVTDAEVSKVSISVYKDDPDAVTNYDLSKPIGNENIITDILFKHKNQIQQIDKLEKSSIRKTISDPRSVIPNGISKTKSNFVLGGNFTKRTIKVVKKLNDNINTVQTIVKKSANIDSVTNQELRSLATKCLAEGIDPIESYKMNDLSQSLSEGFSGLLKKSHIENGKNETLQNLYDYKTKSQSNTNVGPTQYLEFSVDDIKNVDSSTEFELDTSELENGLFFVVFEVLDKNGVTIQKINKKVYIETLTKIYSMPIEPPEVHIVRDNSTYPRRMAKIRQRDFRSSFISVYKKNVLGNGISSEPYRLLTRIPLALSEGFKQINLEPSSKSNAQYRFVSETDQKVQGFDFTSVVVSNRNDPQTNKIVAIIRPTLNGNSIEITNIDPKAVSIRILRRDLTIKEKELSPITDGDFVSVYGKTGSNLTFNDSGLKEEHFYEYWYEFIDNKGKSLRAICGNSFYRPIQESALTIAINNVTVANTVGGVDCKFDIDTVLPESVTDRIKNTSTNQSQDTIFATQIEQQKNDLSKLLAHKVVRIDLQDGTVEDLGILSSKSFSDIATRSNSASTDLREGRKYRYIVSPLLRQADTLFADVLQTGTDSVTKRAYQYSSYKFNHPYSLKRGSLTTKESQKRNHAPEDFEFGYVGSLASVDIEVRAESISLNDISIVNLENTDVITWTTSGDTRAIDHYKIISYTNGIQKVIGKVFHDISRNNFVFIRKLDSLDSKNLDRTYEIVPVRWDYELDQSYIVSIKK